MSGPFAPFLEEQGFVVLDGGLASALEEGGYALDTPLWSARALLEAPERVRGVHEAYLYAGADCITSAGYQASFEGLWAAGLERPEAEQVLRGAVTLAVEARDAFWSGAAGREGRRRPLVAASAGPYGAFLTDGSEYVGRYGVGPEVLERFHRGRLEVLADTPADLLAFETVPSLDEADVIAGLLAGLLARRPETRAWIAFSCRDEGHLRDGTPIGVAVEACAVAGPALAAVGVNCTAPRHMAGLIARIREATELPVVAYPNSGEGFDTTTRSWTGPRAEWMDDVGDWVAAGARILGGCCRVGPAEILELRRRLERSCGS